MLQLAAVRTMGYIMLNLLNKNCGIREDRVVVNKKYIVLHSWSKLTI